MQAYATGQIVPTPNARLRSRRRRRGVERVFDRATRGLVSFTDRL